MPMSGAKGSGLSLMIEILASLAAGNAVLVPALAGAKGTRMTRVAIALDVAMLGEPGAFAASVADLADALTSHARAGDVDPLLTAGERGAALKRPHPLLGLPAPTATGKELREYGGDTNRGEHVD